MHLLALHQDGSNNPEGIATTSDRIRFHPYYTSKDLVGFIWMAILLSLFVFFAPHYLGQRMAVDNSNIVYYYSAIFWDILARMGTRDVSGPEVPFAVKISSSVEQSAGNQEHSLLGSSETTCATSYDENNQFNFWFAGIIDGDGY